MKRPPEIPAYGLYGEDRQTVPAVHCERIVERAAQHDWEIFAHRHDHIMQVIVLDQGTAAARVDGKPLVLNAGDYLFLPRQVVHSFSFAADSDGLVLSLANETLGALGPGSKAVAAHLHSPFAGRQTAASFGMLKNAMEHLEHHRFPREALLGIALIVLADLADDVTRNETTSPAGRRHPVLDRFDAQIAAEFTLGATHRKRSPSEHASDLGLTLGHLSRVCRTSTGQGAAAYLETRRMEEACRLLAYTELSVSQIASHLGYQDASYFTRRFRQTSDRTPTEYRKAMG